ncbi:MAG: hypothetical protein J7501_07185 [Bdellovibrio sp.]|nr:hypothetical protein [Bdellovibrio sp.]
MKSSLSFTLLLVVLFGSQYSVAQSSLEGFSTGRYEIHKSTSIKKSVRRPASEEETKSDDAVVEAASAPKAPAAAAPVVAPAVTPVVEAKKEPVAPSEEPTLSEQAQSLFSSKTEKIYEYYREQVHPEDARNNRLEIEFAPAAIYNDSQSNYSFRDYTSYFNAMKVKANVWFTPLIGVSGKFMFSMGADMDANDANHSRVSSKYEMVDVALNFRKYFGTSRKSNSLEFAILYTEDKMNVPSDTDNRVRIKSSGLGLGLKGRFPTSASYAWVAGGSFFPRLQHHESASNTGVTSGASEENTRMGLEVGGEWVFSRTSQLLWGIEASAERNLFDGPASQPDSSTGTTPSNVSVTNSLYVFTLGYRWGN